MEKETRISIAAENFVERFGDDAPTEALKRAEELRQAGNADSAATWMRIYDVVKVLVERGGKVPH